MGLELRVGGVFEDSIPTNKGQRWLYRFYLIAISSLCVSEGPDRFTKKLFEKCLVCAAVKL